MSTSVSSVENLQLGGLGEGEGVGRMHVYFNDPIYSFVTFVTACPSHRCEACMFSLLR